MTPLDFTLVFLLGLASSLHCVQMCGPIVLAYSLPLAGSGGLVRAHLQYNAGRIFTYVLLGVGAGTLGSAGRLAGIANGARIFSGACMIAAGIFIALPGRSGLVQIQKNSIFSRAFRRGKLGLGLTMGFLPCGLVYAALLKAVETGTAAAGGLTMLAFGLGTAGALLGIGMASSAIGPRLGRWSNRIAATSICLLGAWLVWRGLTTPACHHL